MNQTTILDAIFIDRDGTIGGDDTIHYPGDFECYPYTYSCMEQLKANGLKVFSFTNQPGISEGIASEREFIDELRSFGFDDVFICPHSPKDGCKCRKPGTGMLVDAAQKHQLDLKNCIVIGDRWTDMAAAAKANCTKILVKTGSGQTSLTTDKEKLDGISINYIAENLHDAIQWILQSKED